MAALELDGIVRRFGDTTAVADVSLRTERNDFLVLLGPSGCGKTTLLRMIAGLLSPTEGRILVDGQDVTTLPPRERDLAMVFQNYALYPHLTVERNLGFGLSVRRTGKEELRRRVDEVAELLDLGPLLRRRPKELSGGQRQRVALGRAMVREPRAFLMDEPLSNLDAKLRASTRTRLISLHRRLDTTFVYVTHDQIDAMTMATKVAVLNHGRIEQFGTPVEIYDEPASAFVAGFMGAPPMNLIPAELGTGPDDGLVLRAPDLEIPLPYRGDPGVREVLVGIRPEHLATAPAGELRGRVDIVENLGSEEIAECEIGGARVSVRGARPIGIAPGDHTTLSVRPEHVHLFARQSGRRLSWEPEPASLLVP
ncbi:ABC transporter ATP-binding protein [Pseudonocardia pini]|uniref:ABC transporter ATP-binding protein n=1 Tax=Pseudonocardia pini TaxID=2758030 RepID=UPI0015F123A9|nr:ABC transporter ATP-binding protein [Pseudonocardia pini]